MKICTKCKNQKELTEFGKSKYSKEGHKIYCKECSRADQKKYRDKNKETLKKKNREYFENNKERMFELMIKSIALNKEYEQPFKSFFYNF